MKDLDYNKLREAGWRRPLTGAERAELERMVSNISGERAEVEEELALTELLEKVPLAPKVASNFTARVMAEVRLEEKRHARDAQRGWLGWRGWRALWPRVAVAGLVVATSVVGYHEHMLTVHEGLAKNAVRFTAAVSASDPAVMADFEPIRQLGDGQAKADLELLALMK